MSEAIARSGSNLCFRLSCWVLGLVAFVQLMAGGIALAIRFEASREVVVQEKIVTRLVNVAPPAAPSETARPVVALPPAPELPVESPLPAARPLDAPAIADPVVERLVTEAREARVAEDMGSAIVKLEEARAKAPDEPNVHYELGLVYETMAAYDPALAGKASESYQKVFELGTSGAGALYPLAARKLRDGIAMPVDMRGKLALGRTRIFKDDQYRDGERIVLTIPVSAAPGNEPSADDFFVQLKFFDKTQNGDPVPASPDSKTDVKWVSGEIDWVGGEEVLRVTYILPAPDPSQEHLFGRRNYYGQVVELLFKNELIDSQAWPRHLASMTQSRPDQGPDPLFLEQELPLDGSLLPPLEDEIPLDLSLPPFHER